MTVDRSSILLANETVHAALASSGEYNKSPHFLQENQDKVRNVLEELKQALGDGQHRLLDLGCGTGFIISLAHDLFSQIDGVDITQEMMDLVDLSPGNIFLHKSAAENVPFDSETFDMVTAYSFLDHLLAYEPVIQEAQRVLRTGGIFYSDLNPNRHFTTNLQNIQDFPNPPQVVSREIEGMLHNGDHYEEKYAIDAETLTNAEPIKSFDQGFDPDEVCSFARSIGFSQTDYRYDWYLGQAVMMHERDAGQWLHVDEHLRLCLPATRGLFKYVRFVFRK